MRLNMSKMGIFVVLVEFLGIGLYYQNENYLGIGWCIFWIIGIIYYETKYLKRLDNHIDDIKRQLQQRIDQHKLCSRNDTNHESEK